MSLFRQLMLMFFAGMFLALAPAARADTFTLINTNSGWYNNSGFHNANTNYIAGGNFSDGGGSGFRNFFVFDLLGVPGTVTSASIQIFAATVTGAGVYTLSDVSTPVPTLVAGGSGLTAIHSDLGSGSAFGSIGLTPADTGLVFTVVLNAAAIADIQGRLGGFFAIGGRFDAPNGFAMGFSELDPRNQLTIQTDPVPEPATMLLLGTALAGVGAKMRHRRRARKVKLSV